MKFLTDVVAKFLTDRERVKQNQKSKESIKDGLRNSKTSGDNTSITDFKKGSGGKAPEKESPEFSKKGNVIIPKAFEKSVTPKVRQKIEKAFDDHNTKLLEEILKGEEWIDPKALHHFLQVWGEGAENSTFGKFVTDLLKKTSNEPYMTDFHNAHWRTKAKGKDEAKVNGLTPIPQRVSDLQGVLGKDVPQGGADPFQWVDTKYKVTKNLLAKHMDKPLTINTRSDLIAHDDYLELLNPDEHKVRMHVLTDDAQLSRYLEPGAPSVLRRKDAVKKLVEHDIPVTVVVDQLEHSHLPEELKKRLGTVAKIKQLVGPKVKVAVNHIKLTEDALAKVLKAVGDLTEHKEKKSS